MKCCRFHRLTGQAQQAVFNAAFARIVARNFSTVERLRLEKAAVNGR